MNKFLRLVIIAMLLILYGQQQVIMDLKLELMHVQVQVKALDDAVKSVHNKEWSSGGPVYHYIRPIDLGMETFPIYE